MMCTHASERSTAYLASNGNKPDIDCPAGCIQSRRKQWIYKRPDCMFKGTPIADLLFRTVSRAKFSHIGERTQCCISFWFRRPRFLFASFNTTAQGNQQNAVAYLDLKVDHPAVAKRVQHRTLRPQSAITSTKCFLQDTQKQDAKGGNTRMAEAIVNFAQRQSLTAVARCVKLH
jgi:hypothetical protein